MQPKRKTRHRRQRTLYLPTLIIIAVSSSTFWSELDNAFPNAPELQDTACIGNHLVGMVRCHAHMVSVDEAPNAGLSAILAMGASSMTTLSPLGYVLYKIDEVVALSRLARCDGTDDIDMWSSFSGATTPENGPLGTVLQDWMRIPGMMPRPYVARLPPRLVGAVLSGALDVLHAVAITTRTQRPRLLGNQPTTKVCQTFVKRHQPQLPADTPLQMNPYRLKHTIRDQLKYSTTHTANQVLKYLKASRHLMRAKDVAESLPDFADILMPCIVMMPWWRMCSPSVRHDTAGKGPCIYQR